MLRHDNHLKKPLKHKIILVVPLMICRILKCSQGQKLKEMPDKSEACFKPNNQRYLCIHICRPQRAKSKGKTMACSVSPPPLPSYAPVMAFDAQQFLICSTKIAMSHDMPWPGEARKLGSCQLHPAETFPTLVNAPRNRRFANTFSQIFCCSKAEVRALSVSNAVTSGTGKGFLSTSSLGKVWGVSIKAQLWEIAHLAHHQVKS